MYEIIFDECGSDNSQQWQVWYGPNLVKCFSNYAAANHFVMSKMVPLGS